MKVFWYASKTPLHKISYTTPVLRWLYNFTGIAFSKSFKRTKQILERPTTLTDFFFFVFSGIPFNQNFKTAILYNAILSNGATQSYLQLSHGATMFSKCTHAKLEICTCSNKAPYALLQCGIHMLNSRLHMLS